MLKITLKLHYLSIKLDAARLSVVNNAAMATSTIGVYAFILRLLVLSDYSYIQAFMVQCRLFLALVPPNVTVQCVASYSIEDKIGEVICMFLLVM